MTESGSVFVKICGTTNEEDALLSLAMGADAIGFVFANSPRQVTPSHVAQIIRRLPTESLSIGVFTKQSVDEVLSIVDETSLRGVQLHGSWTPQECRKLSEFLDITILAFQATESGHDLTTTDYQVDCILLDSSSPGSGEIFDWEQTVGVSPSSKIIVSGGLGPENVASAIEVLNPWGVDAVSKLESVPGRKDPIKVREFIRNARIAGSHRI